MGSEYENLYAWFDKLNNFKMVRFVFITFSGFRNGDTFWTAIAKLSRKSDPASLTFIEKRSDLPD